MQETPSEAQIEAAIVDGKSAVDVAAETRHAHRGKRRPSRAVALDHALALCDDAGRTIRRFTGMAFAHDIPTELELSLKRTTKSLEAERRKLRKMR